MRIEINKIKGFVGVSFLGCLLLTSCSNGSPVKEVDSDIDPLLDNDTDILDLNDADDLLDSDTDALVDAEIEISEICGYEPTSFDEYEDCYLDVHCKTLMECALFTVFTSIQECVETLRKGTYLEHRWYAFNREFISRAYQAGRVHINQDQFIQCIRDRYDTDDCIIAYNSLACEKRYTGAINDGDTCYIDWECASFGASCERDCSQTCCPGTCVPKAKLGEPCEFGIVDCEPDLYCSSVVGECVSGDLGASCRWDDCDIELRCDRSTCIPGTTDKRCGTCQPRLSEGASCNGSDELCGGNTRCVGLLMSTAEAICRRISEVGDSCDTWCSGNLYCDRSRINLQNPLGVCRALPGPGESCQYSENRCAGVNYICSSELICVPRNSIGEPCWGQSCEEGSYCSYVENDPYPVCVPLISAGGECVERFFCDSLICTGDEEQPGRCFDWEKEDCSF